MKKKLTENKVGRPKIKEADRNAFQIACKCTKAFYNKITDAAWHARIPVAKYVRDAVKEKFDKESKK